MKTIGQTYEGNYIVEMNKDEMREFQLLAEAIEGNTPTLLRDNYAQTFVQEFNGTFGAIRAFRQANFRLNELTELLTEMRNTIQKVTA